jgi:TrmH family RNA methyltransferase
MEYKKYNKDLDYSYCFGGFPTYEVLTQKPDQIHTIILHDKAEKNKELDNILDLAKKHKIPVTTNGKLVEKLSGKGNVYIMAVFKKYSQELNHNSNQVLLCNPSDMGNLGTIIRVMLGFNYTDLAIIKPCIDVFDPKVIRASMGAIFSTNIKLYNDIDEYLAENKNHIYPFMLKAKETLQETTKKTSPHTLAFGNEAHGLDDGFLKLGTPLLIKHSNKIDSLNLSMSVGIALYEFSK